MTVSTSVLAYEDCYSVMEEALADERGVKVRLPNRKSAFFLRLRCHQARSLDRQKNRETYEKTDPMYSVSAYDKLTLRIVEDAEGWWVSLEQNGIIPGEVVSLSTGEQIHMRLPMAEAQKMLAPPPAPAPPPAEDLGEAFEQIEAEPEPTPLAEILPPQPKLRRI